MSTQEIRARLERFRNGGSSIHSSFSSTLLDQIYRSIDHGGDTRTGESKFYTHGNVLKKHAETMGKSQSRVEDEQIEKKLALRTRSHTEDALLFSSTSGSSDSSLGRFSSSDSESMHASKSFTPSCFAKFRPRPSRNQFVENKESRDLDEIAMVRSKTRALKQPISPGGRISSFLNSIFTAAKKSGTSVKSTAVSEDPNSNRRSKSGQISTASFSRSCHLRNNSSFSSEELRNADQRTVRLYPASTIRVKDDPQTAAARNDLTYYQKIKRKNDLVMRNFHHFDNDLDEDDRASCSSSDLFELDQLAVMSGDRYREELPAYESTTLVDCNRAIRHG